MNLFFKAKAKNFIGVNTTMAYRYVANLIMFRHLISI